MPAMFFRYFSIFLFTFGLSIMAHTVLAADDPSTKGLPESTRLLFKAINENNIESVRAAVDQGANINAENTLGVRPVDLAVDLGYFDLAHFLLAANKAPKKKEEKILLPPPMIPLAAQGNARTDLPPILSGPQVSVPAVNSPPLPAITAPQITAPNILAPRISAPNFAAPQISAPKIIAPASRPTIVPPAISAPRIRAQPRISAPKFAAPAPSTPRISAPTFKAPTLPVAPTRAENLPFKNAVPVPPKISERLSIKPSSISSLDIIAPPEPPPLTTEDGTVVQTPAPLQPKEITSTITPTSNAPESGDEGFMSNVWNSMTGWIPFTGSD